MLQSAQCVRADAMLIVIWLRELNIVFLRGLLCNKSALEMKMIKPKQLTVVVRYDAHPNEIITWNRKKKQQQPWLTWKTKQTGAKF